MAKKSKLTSEELALELRNNHLKDLRQEYIAEPTMLFKVGDRVQHGNIQISIVVEVLDNGKIYLLDEAGEDNNYGKMIPYKRQMYVSWLDLETYRTHEENDKLPSFTEDDDVRLGFSQRSIDGLFCIAYRAGLDFNPPYQREFCWEPSDKVKLIDSIFKNIDIGKFVFIQRDFSFKGPLYEVLDGKQRMRALMDFYEGRFAYKGVFYKDLKKQDNTTFTNYPISFAQVNYYKMTEEYKLKYFLKLNVSGVPQSEEHLAKVKKMYNELVHTKNVL